jgi:hypothetical protein
MNKLEAEQAFGLTRFEGWLTIAGLASGRRGSATSDSAFGPATIRPFDGNQRSCANLRDGEFKGH